MIYSITPEDSIPVCMHVSRDDINNEITKIIKEIIKENR